MLYVQVPAPGPRRICLVLVLLFIADPSLQALLGILVNVMVLLFGIRTAAYVDKQINGLQTSVDAVLGALLIAGEPPSAFVGCVGKQ